MDNTEISLAADRVRSAIRADVRGGFTALVDFASTNAVTAKLKHEALLLKYSQLEANSSEELRALGQEMLDLVERIQLDHAQNWDGATSQARKQRLRELHAEYLRQPVVSEPVFVGRNLGKRYPGFQLQGASLELRPGEVTAVVGQNANGKTTLLRIVAGELRADEGTLQYPALDGRSGGSWAEIKASIAYLPQEIVPWQGSLRDNLHYEAALHGLLGEENEREVEFFIARLALAEHLGKRWSQLSGGTKLRFALARTLIWKPRLLVLDEPLANLDVLAQSRLLQDILDLARSPRYPLAVLMSSQHLHELEAVANEIIFLRGGSTIFNGAMEDVGSNRSYNLYEVNVAGDPSLFKAAFEDSPYGEPSHNGVSYVIKTARDVDAAAVLRRLLSAGVQISYFRDISRSIKSLFE